VFARMGLITGVFRFIFIMLWSSYSSIHIHNEVINPIPAF
jgi:hypothetical protein